MTVTILGMARRMTPHGKGFMQVTYDAGQGYHSFCLGPTLSIYDLLENIGYVGLYTRRQWMEQ